MDFDQYIWNSRCKQHYLLCSAPAVWTAQVKNRQLNANLYHIMCTTLFGSMSGPRKSHMFDFLGTPYRTRTTKRAPERCSGSSARRLDFIFSCQSNSSETVLKQLKQRKIISRITQHTENIVIITIYKPSGGSRIFQKGRLKRQRT